MERKRSGLKPAAAPGRGRPLLPWQESLQGPSPGRKSSRGRSGANQGKQLVVALQGCKAVEAHIRDSPAVAKVSQPRGFPGSEEGGREAGGQAGHPGEGEEPGGIQEAALRPPTPGPAAPTWTTAGRLDLHLPDSKCRQEQPTWG